MRWGVYEGQDEWLMDQDDQQHIMFGKSCRNEGKCMRGMNMLHGCSNRGHLLTSSLLSAKRKAWLHQNNLAGFGFRQGCTFRFYASPVCTPFLNTLQTTGTIKKTSAFKALDMLPCLPVAPEQTLNNTLPQSRLWVYIHTVQAVSPWR